MVDPIIYNHNPSPYPDFYVSRISRDKPFIDKIIEQNERLLPKRDPHYDDVWNHPDKVIDEYINQRRYDPEYAKDLVDREREEMKYMWDIQEQRAWLKTFFRDKIQPNIKNPNNADEIAQYLEKNPDILENAPENIKYLMKELRPGSTRDYAKYFAGALGTLPATSIISRGNK